MAVRLSSEINPEEWLFFLTGGVNLDNQITNKISWLQDIRWDELCRLDNLPTFKVCLAFQDYYLSNVFESNSLSAHSIKYLGTKSYIRYLIYHYWSSVFF